MGIPSDRQAHREAALNREVPIGMNGEQLHPNKDSLAIAKEIALGESSGSSGGGGYNEFGHNSEYWRTLGAAWAGLLTTAHDLTLLYQALAGGGALAYDDTRRRILQEDTLRDMCRCHTHGEVASIKLEENVARGGLIFGDAPASHWGLGFRLNRGDRKFGSSGKDVVFGHHGGAGAMAWTDPVTGGSFVCVTTEPTMCYSEEFNELSDMVHTIFAELHQADQAQEVSPIRWGAEGFDHVAIGVANLSVSRHWYMSVLGLEDYMQHEPTFIGPDLAFLRSGDAALALLHIDTNADGASSSFDRWKVVSRAQKGHFAFRTDGATFWRLHAALPGLLSAHRVGLQQSVAVLCDDFAVQLSMFFEDPDGNEVEVTTWECERDDSCSRFGAVSELSIRGAAGPEG